MSRTIAPLLILLVTCLSGRGNPLIMTHPAYMSSERLEIKLLDDAAAIDGRFHFRSTAKKGDPDAHAHVYLEIPIWVPRDPKNADAATATLLRSSSGKTFHQLTNENRNAWDSAIGLKLNVGKHALNIDSFVVYDSHSKADRKQLAEAWLPRGYCCVIARADFPPAWLAGDPEIRIQYRQGLCRIRDGDEFYYVPEFRWTPDGHSTRDLNQYAMHLSNGSGRTALLGSTEVPPGYSSILPLVHKHPIVLTLRAKD